MEDRAHVLPRQRQLRGGAWREAGGQAGAGVQHGVQRVKEALQHGRRQVGAAPGLALLALQDAAQRADKVRKLLAAQLLQQQPIAAALFQPSGGGAGLATALVPPVSAAAGCASTAAVAGGAHVRALASWRFVALKAGQMLQKVAEHWGWGSMADQAQPYQVARHCLEPGTAGWGNGRCHGSGAGATPLGKKQPS